MEVESMLRVTVNAKSYAVCGVEINGKQTADRRLIGKAMGVSGPLSLANFLMSTRRGIQRKTDNGIHGSIRQESSALAGHVVYSLQLQTED
jgi:hypothetical protein